MSSLVRFRRTRLGSDSSLKVSVLTCADSRLVGMGLVGRFVAWPPVDETGSLFCTFLFPFGSSHSDVVDPGLASRQKKDERRSRRRRVERNKSRFVRERAELFDEEFDGSEGERERRRAETSNGLTAAYRLLHVRRLPCGIVLDRGRWVWRDRLGAGEGKGRVHLKTSVSLLVRRFALTIGWETEV